jgi:hypothetical protein
MTRVTRTYAPRTSAGAKPPGGGKPPGRGKPPGGETPPAAKTWRERAGVLGLAAAIIVTIALYLALKPAGGDNASRNLLPYQALARSLPDADARQFRAIRSGIVAAESDRARASRWPDPSALAGRGIPAFASGPSAEYEWFLLRQGTIVDYFAKPLDPSQPAWLLEIQEPEPGMPPDRAPLDEEHHRLPDGTVLHIYVWMHRYGGQVPVGFVRQPQTNGWIELFTEPPNPTYYNRR